MSCVTSCTLRVQLLSQIRGVYWSRTQGVRTLDGFWALCGLVGVVGFYQCWAWSHLELWANILSWAIILLVGPYWAMLPISSFIMDLRPII